MRNLYKQKKRKNTKSALNFANKNTKNLIYLRPANCVCIYIYTHIFRNKIYNLHQLRNNIISIKRLHIVLKSTTTYIS